jgi:uroporphyrinogen III methyltransferase / synthase
MWSTEDRRPEFPLTIKAMNERPLTGRTILITRAREQSGQFAELLTDLGAEVVELPTIEIVPPPSWHELDGAIDRLSSYQWIIFTSVNGVLFFWNRLTDKGKDALPASVQVCAIGPATARELEARGARVDYQPEQFIAEAIVEGFKAMALCGKQVLLARAKKARDVLPRGLKELGAQVDVVEVYRTIKPKGGAERLKEILEAKKIDAVTFTSSSTVDHFCELLGPAQAVQELKGVSIASIGPVTSRTARERGLEVHIEPEEYTIPALVQAIGKYFTVSPPVRRDR